LLFTAFPDIFAQICPRSPHGWAGVAAQTGSMTVAAEKSLDPFCLAEDIFD